MKLFSHVIITDGKHIYQMGKIIKITNTDYLIESDQPFYNKKTKSILNPNIKWFKHKMVELNTNTWFIEKQRDTKINEILS